MIKYHKTPLPISDHSLLQDEASHKKVFRITYQSGSSVDVLVGGNDFLGNYGYVIAGDDGLSFVGEVSGIDEWLDGNILNVEEVAVLG